MGIGISQYAKNQTSYDFFLGGRNLPWQISMFSIVATETSVLTFVGIPALAYQENNWMFLQLVLGYILGRIFVSYFFCNLRKSLLLRKNRENNPEPLLLRWNPQTT